MKAKYTVHWWDEVQDSGKKTGFHTYAEALEFKERCSKRIGRINVRITSR